MAALFPEHRRVVVVCSAWLATLFERVAARAARTGTTAAVAEAQFEGFATSPPSETPLLPFSEVVCPDRALALAGGR